MTAIELRMWITSYYKDDGNLYGSSVVAPSFEEAQSECDSRGLGEIVEGELFEMIPDDESEET